MVDAGHEPSPWIPAPIRWGVLAVLTVLFVGIGFQQARLDAPAVDEGVDVSSGVAALVHRDLRMVPEHPALPKALAALPALLAGPVVPESEAWHEGEWFNWSDDFVAANEDAGSLDATFLWARLVVVAQGVAIAALLYALASRFFGPDGGLVAAAAWLTTPYFVGLGHFAMLDVPFTLATLALVLVTLRWLDRPTLARTAAVGAVLGLALATRHTGLVLAVWVVLVVVVKLRSRPFEALQGLVVVGLVSVLCLWAVYRGLSPSGPPPEVTARFEGLVATQTSSVAVGLVGAMPLPLEWQAGFASMDQAGTNRPASLAGQSWSGGRWWYFPVAAVLKLPAGLLAAVLAGWVVARRHPARLRLAGVVLAPALSLWFVVLVQPLNLGLRVVLPSVALALVGLGALVAPVRARLAPGPVEPATGARRLARPAVLGVVGLVVASQVAAMVTAAPHSLAWSPPPFRPAYRWVSDSNVDVGQALYEVRDWVVGHDRPFVAVGSTRGLTVGGGSRELVGADPADVQGWVAVGVTPLLDTWREQLSWVRAYCPVGTLGGGSVLVYRFRTVPDTAVGPMRPVEPCFGDEWSSRG
jgi:4-amino-4-deoxy-L-arabinose transferase-like glycosyltransferase